MRHSFPLPPSLDNVCIISNDSITVLPNRFGRNGGAEKYSHRLNVVAFFLPTITLIYSDTISKKESPSVGHNRLFGLPLHDVKS